MSRIHLMKVQPGSEAECYFMDILKKVDVKPETVICRLGAVFGTPYNEYVISDGLYNQIAEYLEEQKGLSH